MTIASHAIGPEFDSRSEYMMLLHISFSAIRFAGSLIPTPLFWRIRRPSQRRPSSKPPSCTESPPLHIRAIQNQKNVISWVQENAKNGPMISPNSRRIHRLSLFLLRGPLLRFCQNSESELALGSLRSRVTRQLKVAILAG